MARWDLRNWRSEAHLRAAFEPTIELLEKALGRPVAAEPHGLAAAVAELHCSLSFRLADAEDDLRRRKARDMTAYRAGEGRMNVVTAAAVPVAATATEPERRPGCRASDDLCGYCGAPLSERAVLADLLIGTLAGVAPDPITPTCGPPALDWSQTEEVGS